MTPGLLVLALWAGAPLHCQAALEAEVTQIKPGAPFYAAVRLTPEPGWHTYWMNPGDSGFATTVKWELPSGWRVGPIEWPVPELMVTSAGTNYCYPHEVELRAMLIPPHNLLTGHVSIGADTQWMACREACVFGHADLTLDLAVGRHLRVNRDARRRIRAVQSSLPQMPSSSLTARRDGTCVVVDLGPIKPPPNVTFFGADATIDPTEPAQVTSDGSSYHVRLQLSPYAAPNPTWLGGILVVPRGETLSGGTRALLVDVPIHVGGSR